MCRASSSRALCLNERAHALNQISPLWSPSSYRLKCESAIAELLPETCRCCECRGQAKLTALIEQLRSVQPHKSVYWAMLIIADLHVGHIGENQTYLLIHIFSVFEEKTSFVERSTMEWGRLP